MNQAAQLIGNLRPTRAMLEQFLGCMLTEPKPNVFFETPQPPLRAAQFSRAARQRGVRLDIRTQLLYRGKTLFINGEAAGVALSPALAALADTRHLPPAARLFEAETIALYSWYTYGWIHPGERL